MKRHQNKKQKQKGMALIILFIFLFVIVTIFISCLYTYVDRNMREAGMYHWENLSCAAAQSGISYAKARIEADYTWEGNNPANNINGVLYGDKVLTVEENWNGNNKCVRGQIINKNNNETAYYYITFTYLPNVCDYVSYNNIGKPDLSGNNLHATKTAIGSNSVLIAAKGVCNGQVVYIEEGFTLESVGGVSSSAVASNKISITMANSSSKLTVDANNLLEPKICSNKSTDSAGDPSIYFTNGTADFNGGSAETWGKYTSLGGVVRQGDYVNDPFNATIKTGTETKIQPLEINDVISRLSSINNEAPANLKAGQYSFVFDAPNNRYVLRYNAGALQKTYYAGAGGMPTEVGAPANKLNGMRMEGTKLYITKPQAVEAAGGVNSLEINGDPSLTSRVKVVEENEAYIVNTLADGNITVKGEFSGDGTVVSMGNITFEGKSVMNTKVDTGVSIFAGGNVTLNPIPPNITDVDVPLSVSNYSPGLNGGISYNDYIKNTDYGKKFIMLGGAFNRYMGGESSLSLYSMVKSKVKTEGLKRLNEQDRHVQRLTLQGFKSTVRGTTALFSDNSKEYNLFRAWEANGFEFNPTDAVFYGLIYTKRNFISSIDGTFMLIGSLIVNSEDPTYGNIIFTNAKGVYFIYDSSYLGVFRYISRTCGLKKTFESKM